MNLSNMDKKTADNLLKAAIDTLNDGLSRFGVKATSKGGQFGPGKLTLKVELTSNDPEESVAGDRAEWTRYAYMFGLKPEHFGLQFKRQGVLVEFAGVAMNRRKFPIRVKEVATGKVFLITDDEAVMRVKALAVA